MKVTRRETSEVEYEINGWDYLPLSALRDLVAETDHWPANSQVFPSRYTGLQDQASAGLKVKWVDD